MIDSDRTADQRLETLLHPFVTHSASSPCPGGSDNHRNIISRSAFSVSKILSNKGKLIQRCVKIFDNLGSNYVWGRQTGCVLKAVIFEPENIQAGFVALDQVVIGE